MSKKKNNQPKGKAKNNERKFKVPADVKLMASLTLKKYKKENDFYDSKKELKRAYYAQLVDYLPDTIIFIIRYGHIEANKELKEALYAKLTDPKLIKEVTKYIKDGNEIENIDLLPNIISDIVRNAAAAQAAAKEKGEEIEFDLSDLVELSKLILKKRLKKLTKAGIDEAVAFDVLSIIPAPKILDKSAFYHIRMLFITLYEHAKTKKIDFSKIMKVLVKDEYVAGVISFALLERKDKVTSFNETQVEFYNTITEYCFKTLEKMDKDTIRMVISSYIQARQKDESQGKDSNRRFYISSLPEDDYPKITKVVKKLLKEKEELKKYL